MSILIELKVNSSAEGTFRKGFILKKIVKTVVSIAFIIYCLALVKVLLLDGRHRSEASVAYFFSQSNLIPFGTVFDYLQKLAADRINADTVFVNLTGNLIVLFPMGCFLPCLFPPFRRFRSTLLLCLGIVFAVELLQPILRIGFFDIDDFIFNIGGACLGFGTVHIPPIRKLLQKMYIYGQ